MVSYDGHRELGLYRRLTEEDWVVAMLNVRSKGYRYWLTVNVEF